MKLILKAIVLMQAAVLMYGCSGTRFQLGQGGKSYGLSTAELLVLDTVDEALDRMEKKIEANGMPEGKTATLQILGVYSPAHLHPYIRRLVVARLENRGLEIVKEKKVVPQGSAYYQDDDFEYWSADTTVHNKANNMGVQERLLSGAKTLLQAPEEGSLPDLRIVLALRVAGIDVMGKDLLVYEEEALNCAVDARLFVFADSKVGTFDGQKRSPNYVYKRRILKFIPIPAPYKELETDRRSMLRKLLDGVFGAGQTVQTTAVQTPGGF